MPRVTPEHSAARRAQILDAARTCFLRDGFHATSMQDIQGEAQLSAGAIYLYFKSKQEIVAGIAAEILETVGRAFEPQEGSLPPVGPGELIDRVIDTADQLNESRAVFSIAVQIWAEAQRDPALHASAITLFGTVQTRVTRVLTGLQQRGMIDPTVDLPTLTMAIIGLVQGYIVQRSLGLTGDREQYRRGAHALMRSGCGNLA
ncbi:MAG: TetR/AcrR family transcriptional regulator [Chloroflexia bacterium]|nr:TetR/AcrR family transcriptional regulator [Chloroflexia bacterium]